MRLSYLQDEELSASPLSSVQKFACDRSWLPISAWQPPIVEGMTHHRSKYSRYSAFHAFPKSTIEPPAETLK